MDLRHRVDVSSLTREAEAGMGHAVRVELDGMSFQERIRTLRKIDELSNCHHRLEPDNPYVTYSMDASKDSGYACLQLYRHIPHGWTFGLTERMNELYADYLDLTSGDEAFMEANITVKNPLPSLRGIW